MKLGNILSAAILAAMTFAGCVKDDANQLPAEGGPNTPQEVLLHATIGQTETRTQFGEQVGTEMPLLWSAGDQIRVFEPSKLTSSYQGISFALQGEGGSAQGTFSKVDPQAVMGTTTATLNYYLALHGIMQNRFNRLWYNNSIYITIPETQTYRPNSVPQNALPMAGFFTDAANGGYTDIRFLNMGSVICLPVYSATEGTTLTDITFAVDAASTVKPAGLVRFSTAAIASTEDVETHLSELQTPAYFGNVASLTLQCNDAPVSTDPTNPTKFYFVVTPGTYNLGFSVTITGTNDNLVKTKSSAFTIGAGQIVPMAPIAYNKPQGVTAPTEAPVVHSYGNGAWDALYNGASGSLSAIKPVAPNPVIVWNEIAGATRYVYTVDNGPEHSVSKPLLSTAELPNGAKVKVWAANSAGKSPVSNEVTVKSQYSLSISDHPDAQGDAENLAPCRWTGNDTDGYTLTIGSVNGDVPTSIQYFYCSLRNGEDRIPYTLSDGYNFVAYSFDQVHYSRHSYANMPIAKVAATDIHAQHVTVTDFNTGAVVGPQIYFSLNLESTAPSRSTPYALVRIGTEYAKTTGDAQPIADSPIGYATCNGWPVAIQLQPSLLEQIGVGKSFVMNFEYGDKSIPVRIAYDPELVAE